MGKVRDLFELFKVKQTLMLVFTGVFAYIAGSRGNINPFVMLLISLSIFLAASGSTGLNMVLDADIDALMRRTRNRPLPAGRMAKREAVLVSTPALVAGLLLAAAINLYAFAAGLIGFLFDILVYTVLLKRRSPWSVAVGCIAGGMPALGGWAAATGGFGAGGLLLMLLVALWSWAHIWTIATYYSEDYRQAGVPMLPVVYGDRVGVASSLVVILMVMLVTLLFVPVGLLGVWGALFSLAPLSLSAGLLARGLVLSEYKKHAYRAFKLLSMYMMIVFMCIAATTIYS